VTGATTFIGGRGLGPLLLLFGLVAGTLFAIPPAQADFADGARAYDAGDYAEALAQWHSAAAAGDLKAQVAIAGLYHFGEGVRQNLTEAARWYDRAARGGNADAQQTYGDLLAKGQGVPRDLLKAHMWLSLAACQGRVWAEGRRREIAAQLGLDVPAKCVIRARPAASGSN
jgi:TPR repeat protein